MKWSGDIMVKLCYQEFGSPEKFFSALEKEGWSFSVDGEVSYLLDNENGLFDYIHVSESEWPKIKKELINYLNKGEEVGVSVKFGNEKASWLMHIYPNFEKIQFSVEHYRKTIPETNITDFSWHLSYIIPGLVKTGYSVEEVVCTHYF